MTQDRLWLFVATVTSASALQYLLVSGRLFGPGLVAPWVVGPSALSLGVLAVPLWFLATPTWSRIQSRSLRYALVVPISTFLMFLAFTLPVVAVVVLSVFE